jgi:hypothetical protein
MVLLDPPAPAARVEVGLGAVGALRLYDSLISMTMTRQPAVAKDLGSPDGIGTGWSGDR